MENYRVVSFLWGSYFKDETVFPFDKGSRVHLKSRIYPTWDLMDRTNALNFYLLKFIFSIFKLEDVYAIGKPRKSKLIVGFR